jgi:hypothetical protein
MGGTLEPCLKNTLSFNKKLQVFLNPTHQHIVTNYMEQGPLEADSFAASRFAGIPRNCNCAGLFCVLSGVRHGYLSQ